MDETLNSSGPCSSTPLIPLRTLSCHQCIMLLEAQGFSNFRSAFSEQNLTGEDLIYVETVDDIAEINTDMLRIQMRRMLAKLLEWKVNGIRRSEFFPKVEVIPLFESTGEGVVVEPESQLVGMEETRPKLKRKYTKSVKKTRQHAAVEGTGKGTKRKFEHSLITNQQEIIMDGGEDLQSSSDDDGLADEQPCLELPSVQEIQEMAKSQELADLFLGESLMQIRTLKVLDIVLKMEFFAEERIRSLLEGGLLSKLIAGIQASLARNSQLGVAVEGFQIINRIFYQRFVQVQEACNEENYHMFIKVMQTCSMGTNLIGRGIRTIHTIVVVCSKKDIMLPIEDCVNMIQPLLTNSKLSRTIIEFFHTLAKFPFYSDVVKSHIHVLVATVVDNVNSGIEADEAKVILALKYLEEYFSRNDTKFTMKPDDSKSLFAALWKWSQGSSSSQPLQLQVDIVLGKLFGDHHTFTTEEGEIFLQALLRNNQDLPSSDYRIASSLVLILKFLRANPAFAPVATDLKVTQLLDKLTSIDAAKHSKVVSNTLMIIKDYMKTAETRHLISPLQMVTIFEFLVTLMEVKPTKAFLIALIFNVLSIIVGLEEFRDHLQSPTGNYQYFQFIVISLNHNDNAISKEVMNLLLKWFPPPSLLNHVDVIHEKLFPLISNETLPHHKFQKNHLLLLTYVSKMWCLPDSILREILNTLLKRVYIQSQINYSTGPLKCCLALCRSINKERFWCNLTQWKAFFDLATTMRTSAFFAVELLDLYIHFLSTLPDDKEIRKLYLPSAMIVCELAHLSLHVNLGFMEVSFAPKFSMLNKVVALVMLMSEEEMFRNYFYEKRSFKQLEEISKQLQILVNTLKNEEIIAKIKLAGPNIIICMGLIILPSIAKEDSSTLSYWEDFIFALHNLVQYPKSITCVIDNKIHIKILKMLPAFLSHSNVLSNNSLNVLCRIFPYLSAEEQNLVRDAVNEALLSCTMTEEAKQVALMSWTAVCNTTSLEEQLVEFIGKKDLISERSVSGNVGPADHDPSVYC